MDIRAMKVALSYAFKADIPIMLWGPPGIGKTQGLYQYATQHGYTVVDVRLSQVEPVDLRGIPFKDEASGRSMWALPSMWPDENDTETKYIIFFDEINHGDQSTLSASFQAIQERMLGEYKFPKGCRFAAAGNRSKDRTYANELPVALKNRFLHIDISSSYEGFTEHAVKAQFHPLVVGFSRFKPRAINELIEHGNNEEEFKRTAEVKTHNAISTPRSMEMVSDLLYAATDKQGVLDYDGIKPLIAGAVGEEVAVKFNGYANFYKDLPDIDKLIKRPNDFDVPDNPGMLYAIATALSSRMDDSNADNIVKYLIRMEGEYQAMCMKDALSRDMSLIATPAFADWTNENDNVLF